MVTVEAAVIAEAVAAAVVLAEAVAPAAVEEEDNKKCAPVSGGTLFICPAFY